MQSNKKIFGTFILQPNLFSEKDMRAPDRPWTFWPIGASRNGSVYGILLTEQIKRFGQPLSNPQEIILNLWRTAGDAMQGARRDAVRALLAVGKAAARS
jgi:hypothetical protein